MSNFKQFLSGIKDAQRKEMKQAEFAGSTVMVRSITADEGIRAGILAKTMAIRALSSQADELKSQPADMELWQEKIEQAGYSLGNKTDRVNALQQFPRPASKYDQEIERLSQSYVAQVMIALVMQMQDGSRAETDDEVIELASMIGIADIKKLSGIIFGPVENASELAEKNSNASAIMPE